MLFLVQLKGMHPRKDKLFHYHQNIYKCPYVWEAVLSVVSGN